MTSKDIIFFVGVVIFWVVIAYLCAKYIGAWAAIAVIVGGVSWIAWPRSSSRSSVDD